MWQKLFSLAGSWKTSLLGALALICSGTDMIGILPDKYRGAMTGTCMVLVSLGVIVSKDFNKTNAAVASTQTQTVPITAPTDNTSIIVKTES